MVDPVSIGVFIVLPIFILVLSITLLSFLLYRRLSGASQSFQIEHFDEEYNNDMNQLNREEVNFAPLRRKTHKADNDNIELVEFIPKGDPYTSFKNFWSALKIEIRKFITLEGENKAVLKNELARVINEDGSAKWNYNNNFSLGTTETGQLILFQAVFSGGEHIQLIAPTDIEKSKAIEIKATTNRAS